MSDPTTYIDDETGEVFRPREWSIPANNIPLQLRRVRQVLAEVEAITRAASGLDDSLVADLEQHLTVLSPSMARRLLTVQVGALQTFVEAVAAEHALLDLQPVRDTYVSRRQAEAAARAAHGHQARAAGHADRADGAALVALDAALRAAGAVRDAERRARRAEWLALAGVLVGGMGLMVGGLGVVLHLFG